MRLRRDITRTITLLVAILIVILPSVAQNSKKIAEQQRVIANLEKRIAEDERKIKNLKNSKSSTQKKVSALTRQIESRNRLLNANRKQINLLNRDINRTDSTARKLSLQLAQTKSKYAELVRESYRNYRHNNYLTYLFSAESFTDAVRRLSIMRNIALMRDAKIKEIDSLNHEVARHRDTLARRQEALTTTRRNKNCKRMPTRLVRQSKNYRNRSSRLCATKSPERRNWRLPLTNCAA